MKPLCFHLPVSLDLPTSFDKTADAERLRDALDREGYGHVEIPVDLLRELPLVLRRTRPEETVNLKPVLGFYGTSYKLIDLTIAGIYGLAIDIGTTNIALSLFDLGSGQTVGTLDVENPQIRSGDDVLTRVHRSMLGEDLHRPLIDGINNAISSLCMKNGLHTRQVVAVVVAGNTIMTHYFLGLPVENIPMAPYVPVVHKPEFLSGRDVSLIVHEHAPIYIFPNAGSYVGGDIVSGVLATGMYREEEPCLFADVGTNAEIVLGSRDWLLAAAGAAGPALEGGISAIGRRAEPGSILHVMIDRATGKVKAETMGEQDPRGVCGSGMIDLVSEMFDAGIIDQQGRLNTDSERFVIFEAADRTLSVTEGEIENFLRSKAAMFTSLSVLVRSVGLTFQEIRKVFVAGALGCGIDIGKARKIGMLPDIASERFVPCGNASLKGAEMFLLDRDLYSDIEKISSMITYRELNEDGDFMREFPGALFIPHTDKTLLS